MNIGELFSIISTSGINCDLEDFDPDVSFKDNGIDSLDTYTIFLGVEESLGVSLENVPLDKIDSAKKLLDYINSR